MDSSASPASPTSPNVNPVNPHVSPAATAPGAWAEELSLVLKRHQLTRIEYEHEGLRLVLEKTPAPVIAQQSESLFSRPAFSQQGLAATDGGAGVALADSAEAASAGNPLTQPKLQNATSKCTVKAPLIGIAYRSKDPESPPFVQAGDQVQEGTVLCLIEAMKMFNEIKAPVSGVITAVHFEDAHLVEHGAPLFSID